MIRAFSFFLLLLSTAFCDTNQILYLVQANNTPAAIKQYKAHAKVLGRHDFELLEQMGQIALVQGAKSKKPEEQLLSIYGAGIAGYTGASEIYEIALKSSEPMTQMAAIQYAGQMQDDRSEEVLRQAFSSSFFLIRMEAAYELAKRKSPYALGLIESLMYKLPHEYWVYFPELYAIIGTADASQTLRRLSQDSWTPIRLSSYLIAAKYKRDDFLHPIRSALSHLNPSEQEAAATAVGYLGDSHSIPQLMKLAKESNISVALAAASSLCSLGETSYSSIIFEEANRKNLHAIYALKGIANSEEVLSNLCKNENRQVRINASLALLERKDKRAIKGLEELLFPDESDLGFYPSYTPGHALLAWKVVPSAQAFSMKTRQDVVSITNSLREKVLIDILAIGDREFLHVANRFLTIRKKRHIPLIIHMLESVGTDEAETLLRAHSRAIGAPFIRAYATLALVRMKNEPADEKLLLDWVEAHKTSELIRMRPAKSWTTKEESSNYTLSPEETSLLLIESLETIANRHDTKGIDLLLDAMQAKDNSNQYALAGLLLKAIQ